MKASALRAELRPHRYGAIMTPQPGNPLEAAGVCNPGGVVGPDGAFYLFPRLVAAGNLSRIGVARVTRHPDGRPAGVRRLGVVLEPAHVGPRDPHLAVRTLDRRTASAADLDYYGCEDARVCYVPALSAYLMLYTALGRDKKPRIAVALSHNLLSWSKLGLLEFAPYKVPAVSTLGYVEYADLAGADNKDALWLPEPVTDPAGTLAWAVIHRPSFPGLRPAIWMSYLPLQGLADGDFSLRYHYMLARPQADWEEDRMGAGCITKTADGWLLLYHGAQRFYGRQAVRLADKTPGWLTSGGLRRVYSAGAMLLHPTHPHTILARTRRPMLTPQTRLEREGAVNDVVFPTAVEARGDGFDMYYGSADTRICCARLELGAA